MGTFKQKMILEGPKSKKEAEVLVDTGSSISMIDKKLAEELGIPPLIPVTWTTPKGKIKEHVSTVGLEIDGCRTVAAIGIADVDFPVLEANVLQSIDAIIDMKAKKVIPQMCEPFRI